MTDINLSNVLPKLSQFVQDIYSNTEKGSQIALSKSYHLPSIKDYLFILNTFIELLVPNDVSLCSVTGRVHTKWYYPTYYILVEPISGGDMYNISIVPNGLSSSPAPSTTSVTLNDLVIILLLHTLSNKVGISEMSETIDELVKVRNVVCKKPLVKASLLPRL